MKSKLFVLLVAVATFFTSCLEVVQEVNIKPDGSGDVSTYSNLGPMLEMVKAMGQMPPDLKDKMGGKAIDTIIQLKSLTDSLKDLSDADRKLLANGTFNLKLNLDTDEFSTRNNIPFKSLTDINRLEQLSATMMDKGLTSALDKGKKEGEGEEDDMPSVNLTAYYTTTYGKNLIERKLDKTKYAGVDNDEGLKAVKEMSSLGVNPTTSLVINLPRAAKKVEGKNATLSEDKKKVTIKGDVESFLNDGSAMEFRIEY
ncbi:hypothetical protein [Terrimonas ferruginea]|uniref:hypothetical protein n=1 Tax=Terrimonas ferruginea TaxID=249 RepID=UPI00041693C3|nr:hypothetical protein [Terrimonas ferruginea]